MKFSNELELEKFVKNNLKRNIRVFCNDGDEIIGLCCGFTKALDNTPEVAEIGLRTKTYSSGVTCITLPEIDKIEVID